MKKLISVIAVAGVITAFSISAFAAEVHNTPSNTPASAQTEPAITEVAEGLDPMATVEDKNLYKEDNPAHSGVRLVEDGGEYSAELGEGLSRTDTRKDLVDDLVAPIQQ